MKNWLFNPFTRIAGLQALGLGSVVMFVTAVGAYYSNVHFNGVLDAHFGRQEKFTVYVVEQIIAWGCPLFLFYFLGFFLSSSKFRFIDIAGTIAVSRIPMILIVIIAFFSKNHMQSLKPNTVDNVVLAIGILMLLPIIWMITLMYNAVTVSINAKGTKAKVGFIGGLIVAEVISILLNQLLHSFIP